MAVTFPLTTKYFLRFRHSDTGLTPSFASAGCYLKWADDLTDVDPGDVPSIIEIGGGTYYFEWTWASADEPDVIFQVDGGASIPTEEVRYIADTISPRDFFLDMASSNIYQTVWADKYDYSTQPPTYDEFRVTKGEEHDYLYNTMGSPDDEYVSPTLFGRVRKAAVIDVMGGMDGDGLIPGNNVKEVYDRIGDPNQFPNVGQSTVVAMIAAVWDQVDYLPYIIMGYSGNPETPTLGPTLLELGGTGFVSATHSLVAIADGMGGITGSVDVSLANMQDMLQRALGMLHENSVLDQTQFQGGNLSSARLRLYDSAANAAAAQAAANEQPPAEQDNGKIAVYAINATYTGSNLKDYLVTLEWSISQGT